MLLFQHRAKKNPLKGYRLKQSIVIEKLCRMQKNFVECRKTFPILTQPSSILEIKGKHASVSTLSTVNKQGAMGRIEC